jgi:deoxyribodipyrimidine photo-lyase
MQQQQSTSLIWFGNNLRTQDNTVLQSALSTSKRVIGVYFLEPYWFETNNYGFNKMGRFRAKFLLETLKSLQQELQKLNITLLVFQDSAKHQMNNVVSTYNVCDIFLQKEWTYEEQNLFQNVKNTLSSGVNIHEVYDQFLFHPEDVSFNLRIRQRYLHSSEKH